MKKLLAAAGVVFALSAQAGTVQITASGQASMRPEYVITTAQVVSRCYAKSREAADANAKLAQEIEDAMKPYVAADLKGAYTQVGGAFSRLREQEYTGGNTQVEYCAMGWRTEKTLSLKLKDIAKLPDLQDAVLNIVDRTAGAQTGKGAQTWVVWGNPQPAICDESRAKLADSALKDAMLNARRELNVLASSCDMHNVKLVSIGLANQGGREMGQSYRLAAAQEAPGGSGASFTFGDLSEQVSRSFTFEFDGGAEECKVPAVGPSVTP